MKTWYVRHKKEFLGILPLLLVTGFIMFPFFIHPGYLFFTDFSWGPNISLIPTATSFLPNLFAATLHLFLPSDIVEKMCISAIFLFLLYAGKRSAEATLSYAGYSYSFFTPIIISLFAVFNPFVYDRVMYGQFGIVTSLACMLLAYVYLLSLLQKDQLKSYMYFGIWTGFAILFSAQFLFFIFVLTIGVMLAGIVNNSIPLKDLVKGFALSFLIILLINCNWLYAYAVPHSTNYARVTTAITSQELLTYETAGSTGVAALGNVLLMSGFWGKDQFRYLDLTTVSSDWGRSFFLLLPLIGIGLWSGIQSRKTKALSIVFIGVFLLAVVLAVGIRLPIVNQLTYFLFNHVPFYKGLRETQKWVSVEILTYIFFLTLGITVCTKFIFVRTNALACGLFLTGILIMQAPFLLFGFGGQVHAAEFPPDWKQANQLMVENGCNGDTLFLPWHLYMSFSWIGSIVSNPASEYFTCPILTSQATEWNGIYDDSANPEEASVEEWINSQGHTSLLESTAPAIHYIILTKEVDWQNYLWAVHLPHLQVIQNSPTLIVLKVDHG